MVGLSYLYQAIKQRIKQAEIAENPSVCPCFALSSKQASFLFIISHSLKYRVEKE